jgi:hypothetical protein
MAWVWSLKNYKFSNLKGNCPMVEVVIEAKVVTMETETEMDMMKTTNSLSVESSKKQV